MNLIQPTNFCKINEILTGKDIFIIPNFQRPYVWGEQQFKDLFNDLEKAARNNGFHYLSAIHVLKLQPIDWANLVDEKNEDCQKLKDNYSDLFGNLIPLYAVVDGQQRLTTIFILAHILAKSQKLPINLFATLQSTVKVPRLIQSPTDDHFYMQKMLVDYHAGNIQAEPQSAAQRRLKEGLELAETWAKQNKNAIGYLLADGLQTSVIRLETDYGLTSFLTLNDRGKSLTVLERLKAAILQAVFESGNCTATTLANKWHSAFGRIYKVLDKLSHIGLFRDGEEGDQEMVKLFSCYLRLQTDAKSIWQSADAAYDEFFRATLSGVNTNIPIILTNWLTAIEEVGEGLEHLHDCLTDSSNAPSILFANNSTLVDDYKAIFLSLGLQPHLFALLLKFRALTKQSWHIPYPINVAQPITLVKIIQDHLQEVRQKAQAVKTHEQVLTYIDQLENQSMDIKPRDKLSMLEAVERLQILNWNLEARWYETFKKSCNTNIVIGNSAENIVGYWFLWCGGHDFLSNVLTRWNDPNFRYLLREMERGCGQYIHNNRDLQLEHIFPQTPDDEPRFKTIGGYTAFGYTDKEEYSRQGVWRSGNLTWLTASCNASLGNSMPDDKAAEYISCTKHIGGGLSGSSHIQVTHKIGNELRPIQQDYKSYRWFISARCAELALFSVRRFI